MDESAREDGFEPTLASTPVKARVRCLDLYDSDRDTSSLETPTKRCRGCSERWLNFLDDTTSTVHCSSFRSDSSRSVNFNCSAEERRGPVWVTFIDSASNDYLESKNGEREWENPSSKQGMLVYDILVVINLITIKKEIP